MNNFIFKILNISIFNEYKKKLFDNGLYIDDSILIELMKKREIDNKIEQLIKRKEQLIKEGEQLIKEKEQLFTEIFFGKLGEKYIHCFNIYQLRELKTLKEKIINELECKKKEQFEILKKGINELKEEAKTEIGYIDEETKRIIEEKEKKFNYYYSISERNIIKKLYYNWDFGIEWSRIFREKFDY